MVSGSRFVFTAGALILLLGGVGLLRPQWLADLRLDWWNWPEVFRRFEFTQRRSAELEEQRRLIQQRTRQKYLVFQDLADGRITLLEAGAWFRDLDDSPSEVRLALLPGSTREERYCRKVIRYVRSCLRWRPDPRGNELIERLERELAAELARPGGLQFRPFATRTAGDGE